MLGKKNFAWECPRRTSNIISQKKIARVFEICVIKELRTVDGNWLIKAFGHFRV